MKSAMTTVVFLNKLQISEAEKLKTKVLKLQGTTLDAVYLQQESARSDISTRAKAELFSYSSFAIHRPSGLAVLDYHLFSSIQRVSRRLYWNVSQIWEETSEVSLVCSHSSLRHRRSAKFFKDQSFTPSSNCSCDLPAS